MLEQEIKTAICMRLILAILAGDKKRTEFYRNWLAA